MAYRAIYKFFLCLGITVGISELSSCACPGTFIEISGTCFDFRIDASQTWGNARIQCQDMGAFLHLEQPVDLAILHNCTVFKELVHYIIDQPSLQPPSGWSYWIGASDAMSEMEWFWVDGTVVELGPPWWGSSSGVSEPQYNPEQNCAQLYRNDQYYFHDGICTKLAYPLCQILK